MRNTHYSRKIAERTELKTHCISACRARTVAVWIARFRARIIPVILLPRFYFPFVSIFPFCFLFLERKFRRQIFACTRTYTLILTAQRLITH